MPLAQIARRYSEREGYFNDLKKKENKTTLEYPHNTGPLVNDSISIKPQYKILRNKSFKLNFFEPKNSCVLLKDGTFGLVMNIVDCDNDRRLIMKKINSISSLYNNPDSRYINIHKGIFSNQPEFSSSVDNILFKE